MLPLPASLSVLPTLGILLLRGMPADPDLFLQAVSRAKEVRPAIRVDAARAVGVLNRATRHPEDLRIDARSPLGGVWVLEWALPGTCTHTTLVRSVLATVEERGHDSEQAAS